VLKIPQEKQLFHTAVTLMRFADSYSAAQTNFLSSMRQDVSLPRLQKQTTRPSSEMYE
jgi:hypothetical protein